MHGKCGVLERDRTHREKEGVSKLVFYAQSTGKRREGDRG